MYSYELYIMLHEAFQIFRVSRCPQHFLIFFRPWRDECSDVADLPSYRLSPLRQTHQFQRACTLSELLHHRGFIDCSEAVERGGLGHDGAARWLRDRTFRPRVRYVNSE